MFFDGQRDAMVKARRRKTPRRNGSDSNQKTSESRMARKVSSHVGIEWGIEWGIECIHQDHLTAYSRVTSKKSASANWSGVRGDTLCTSSFSFLVSYIILYHAISCMTTTTVASNTDHI